MGGLIHYLCLSKLRGGTMRLEPFDDAIYIHQLVDIFVRGIHEAGSKI